ncbi:uncharacterized protein LOC128237717 [Mya arenaria]|uniref:uncharacterized protein LOC128237717 n=1 Tax=Mya arenaria TaxID=6604 RepID=UPI0022E25D1E|nr:uncharacterized protein LOC128237717 [Mya arenaria]
MCRRELPSQPWEHLSADFLGPLPSGENLLVIVDYYSRWIEVFIMKTTTSEKIINCLDSIFCVHGIPVSLQTDNAQNFNSKELNDYLTDLNIEHRNTTPYWPQANGEVEIQNKSIMKRLRIAHVEKKNMRTELQTYLMMYRYTPHSTTGMSPAEMLFKRKIRTKIPDISDYRVSDHEIRDRDSERKGKGKIYGDNRRNARESDIKEGDLVLVKQKKQDKLSTVFNSNSMSVVDKQGNSVIVESKEGVRYSRNVSHVKKFYSNDQSRESEKSKEVENVLDNVKNHLSVKNNFSENKSVQSEKNVLNEYRVESGSNSNLENNQEAELTEIEQIENPVETEDVKSPTKTVAESFSRPSRVRKMPQKYSDFIMSNK